MRAGLFNYWALLSSSDIFRFMEKKGTRTLHHQDAITWLESSPILSASSFVTSLPDVSEFPALSLEEWKSWFSRAVSLILSRCPDEGVAIFYQTDVKREGTWVDKGYLCQNAADRAGSSLLWHKVVCRIPPGKISFGRPAYSHLLCFSKGVKAEVPRSTQDVLVSAGEATWTRGMGVDACLLACRFILSETTTSTVVDPFCGHGTVLAVANELGLDAIGVELSSKRVKKAKALQCLNFQLA